MLAHEALLHFPSQRKACLHLLAQSHILSYEEMFSCPFSSLLLMITSWHLWTLIFLSAVHEIHRHSSCSWTIYEWGCLALSESSSDKTEHNWAAFPPTGMTEHDFVYCEILALQLEHHTNQRPYCSGALLLLHLCTVTRAQQWFCLS